MNRQERRRLARQGASESYIEKRRKDEAYDKAFDDGMLKAIEITFYMTAYTLNYKLGFGRKRLVETMGWIYNNIDAFRSGHLSRFDFDTIKKEIEDMGVRLK